MLRLQLTRPHCKAFWAAGYYRWFIKAFAEISAVPFSSASTTANFYWNDCMQGASDELKRRFTSTSVLGLPDFQWQFTVETETSSVATGSELSEKAENGKFVVVYSTSCTMSSSEMNYSAYERGALAVIYALKKFKVYFSSEHLLGWISDLQALQYISRKKTFTDVRQGQWNFWKNMNFKTAKKKELGISEHIFCLDTKSWKTPCKKLKMTMLGIDYKGGTEGLGTFLDCFLDRTERLVAR